ncbi:MAG: ABC transporter substrate-binding protein [Dehalococcoidia bacterium]|nr:ABC transporter substrate-binding protein [Dehalococcoidia bacterium]
MSQHPRPFPRRRFLAGAGGLAFATAFLAACGESDAGDDEAATVTIDDYFGPVTIPADPQRVVAGDSVTLGNMLALGAKPIGAGVNRNSLPGYLGDQMDGVADLTADSGIDVEQALALGPDLAITFAGFADDPWNQDNYDRYKAALPTFGYQYGYTYIEEITLNLTEVARALNRSERAQELIDQYEERVAGLRQRTSDAGLADKPVSVIRLSQDGNYSIRIGSSESIVFRALGIAQPEGQRNPDDFSIEVSLENLNLLNEADTVFVYVDDNAASEQSVVTENAVWQSLEPVRNNRVHFVNSGIWNSIDIIGLMHILDDVEELLIAPAEA